jgi:hypothetical protein
MALRFSETLFLTSDSCNEQKGFVVTKKPLVDCSFTCPDGTYFDFNVWPRRGQTKEAACLSKLRARTRGRVGGCELLRSRFIDGIGKPLRFTGKKRRVRIVRDT